MHGRWYNPDTGLFISPDEKGECFYGSGNNPLNEMWVQFVGGAIYQWSKNNLDTLSVLLQLSQPYRNFYNEQSTKLETYVPDTLPTRFGRVVGSGVSFVQWIAEIDLSPTIAGGGTLLSCLTTGAETLGVGCFAGAGASVAAGEVVLVHGLAVSVVSLGNGSQQVISLMAGSGGSGRSFSDILQDDDLFMQWLNRGHPVNQPLSADQASAVLDKLQKLGLNPRFDRTGQIGRFWKGPHINVQVGGSNIHIPVTGDFMP